MAKQKVDGISFADLEKSLKQKQFAPVYLFFGEEDFLISEALRTLIEHAVEETSRSFNFDVLYGGDIDARQIIAIASSYPMMTDRRVVIVKEFEKVGNKEILVPYLEKPSPSTCLGLVAAKTDFRQKVFDVLKKNAVLVECRSPYDNEIPSWIQARVKKRGKTIHAEACQLLHARTGNSLRVVESEIEKLFIYVENKKEINVEDVEEVVGMSKQFNIFELQRAIGSLQLTRALEILEHMLDSGESPIAMVIMLTRYFQKISSCHELRSQRLNEYSLAGKLSISPIHLKEYLEAAKNFTVEDINTCYRHLLEADQALKLSADEKITMTLLLYKIMKKVKSLENESI